MHVVDMNETSSAMRCKHESKDNDWSHWLNSSLNNEFAWKTWIDSEFASMTWKEKVLWYSKSESEVSLLQWHSTRRNRLETSDEMSLKHSMKWAWNTLC